MNEFGLIEHFFNTSMLKREDVVLGIGDDCAILQPPYDQELLITTDTLVSGVHFLAETSAYDIGFKSLAVNLSDLAAKAATPAWITLALTLPHANEPWLTDFSKGLFELANRYQVQLIGGDLTKGPLTITIQAMGFVPKAQSPRRSGAKPGDLIYVTHTLGDAALGLACLKKSIVLEKSYQAFAINRHYRPEPRIEMGKEIRGIANASIDISDGLVADLSHILKSSNAGAIIDVDQLPLSEAMQASVSVDDAIVYALNGGDDYEICFTIAPEKIHLLGANYTCIGKITKETGLNLHYQDGKKYNGDLSGYKHF